MFHDDPDFTGERTGPQTGDATCWESHGWNVAQNTRWSSPGPSRTPESKDRVVFMSLSLFLRIL